MMKLKNKEYRYTSNLVFTVAQAEEAARIMLAHFRPNCPWCNNIQPEKCWACKGN